MKQDWLSVEQVAEMLGLHVRTVRGYVRDGRLKAVRIGKQYRIARTDLDSFTGRRTSPTALTRPPEVSTIVEFDGIEAAAADRLSTLLVASAQMSRDAAEPLHVRTVYDETRLRLTIIMLGGLAVTAATLHIIEEIAGAENGVLPTQPDQTEAPRD